MLLKRTRVFSSDACVLYSSAPPESLAPNADESAPGAQCATHKSYLCGDAWCMFPFLPYDYRAPGSVFFFRGTHNVRDELQLSHFVG